MRLSPSLLALVAVAAAVSVTVARPPDADKSSTGDDINFDDFLVQPSTPGGPTSVPSKPGSLFASDEKPHDSISSVTGDLFASLISGAGGPHPHGGYPPSSHPHPVVKPPEVEPHPLKPHKPKKSIKRKKSSKKRRRKSKKHSSKRRHKLVLPSSYYPGSHPFGGFSYRPSYRPLNIFGFHHGKHDDDDDDDDEEEEEDGHENPLGALLIGHHEDKEEEEEEQKLKDYQDMIGTFCRYQVDSNLNTFEECTLRGTPRGCKWDAHRVVDGFKGACLCPRTVHECLKEERCYWFKDPHHKRNAKCISSAERFYNVLAKLLKRRGKNDFSINMEYKSAPARASMPYGYKGPTILDYGSDYKLRDGVGYGYSGHYPSGGYYPSPHGVPYYPRRPGYYPPGSGYGLPRRGPYYHGSSYENEDDDDEEDSSYGTNSYGHPPYGSGYPFRQRFGFPFFGPRPYGPRPYGPGYGPENQGYSYGPYGQGYRPENQGYSQNPNPGYISYPHSNQNSYSQPQSPNGPAYGAPAPPNNPYGSSTGSQYGNTNPALQNSGSYNGP